LKLCIYQYLDIFKSNVFN